MGGDVYEWWCQLLFKLGKQYMVEYWNETWYRYHHPAYICRFRNKRFYERDFDTSHDNGPTHCHSKPCRGVDGVSNG
jgi:hypothetical protein